MGTAWSGQHRRCLSTCSATGQSHCYFHNRCHHRPQMGSLPIPLSATCVCMGFSTSFPGKKPLGDSGSTQSLKLPAREVDMAGSRERDRDQAF